MGCLFSIYSSFFVVQARRRKEKEDEKEKKSRFGTLIFVSMETISMKFWYGLLVWNFSMEIPPCLSLGRKNPNQRVFSWVV